jgi:hypothetical protein
MAAPLLPDADHPENGPASRLAEVCYTVERLARRKSTQCYKDGRSF